MVGSTILHYRIVRLLGSGGMGEVYAAEDTRLHRMVALKILPRDVVEDADHLVRFQREAQAIAALNHPNVVTVYAVEEAEGRRFLTMELVDGQTLTALLHHGGVPLGSWLSIAQPLVDAVGAAHAQGVVHRDLKPSNIMIARDGRVKVLDFGLAKLQPREEESEAATITARMTAAHQVLGTPAYMSPEQAEGRAIDHRTDIFSLGVVLYEMAAGKRPFTGDTSVSIISSILKDTPPPLAEARPDLPSELDRIVRRCLAKDPARRYQSAIDLRIDIEELAQDTAKTMSTAGARGTRRPWLVPAAVAGMVGMIGTAFFGMASWRSRVAPAAVPHATFTQLTSQPAAELFSSLSPDGRWIVYAAEGDGNRDIYLHSTSGQTPINLTTDSTADDDQPAFSPDGERIAFRSDRDGGGIFVMGRTGEGVRRVTRGGFNPAWSPDGTQLVYSTVATELKPQNAEQRGQLMIVGIDGGPAKDLFEAGMLPSWSPHGHRIAFSTGRNSNVGRANVVTIRPDGSDLVAVTADNHLNWNAVWAPDGDFLYFVSNRGGSMNIWRIAVDEITGQPQSTPQPLTTPASFAGHLSMAGQQLAYSAVMESQNIHKLAFDPVRGEFDGAPQPVTSGSRFWANPDPSPDGSSLVMYSQVAPEGDLYIAPTDGRGALRQLTSDAATDRVPRWSPDGEWIAMFSDRAKELHAWMVRRDGSDLRQLTPLPSSVAAWSPDGRRLAVTRQSRGDEPSATIIDAQAGPDGRGEDLPPATGTHTSFAPNSWSPDGQRLAGQNGFTVPGISVYSLATRTFERLTEFGEWPVWLPDGNQILFVTRGREFHVLDTRTRTTRLVYSSYRDTLGPPRLSRDGRTAYFSRRITEADVWIAKLQ